MALAGAFNVLRARHGGAGGPPQHRRHRPGFARRSSGPPEEADKRVVRKEALGLGRALAEDAVMELDELSRDPRQDFPRYLLTGHSGRSYPRHLEAAARCGRPESGDP